MHVEAYRRSLADRMGLAVARFDEPGLDIVAGEERRGRGRVSHYRVGDHSVIWTDPELPVQFEELANGQRSIPFEEFRAWAAPRGGRYLGAGYEHVLTAPFASPRTPDGVQRLDGDDAEVRLSVQRFIANCDPHDVEAADFEPDDLDEFLVGLVDDDGLSALAGGRAFAARPGFHDVGVLVDPDHRRRGFGRAVVAHITEIMLAARARPLYRCDTTLESSWRLCRGLGYVSVVELEAFQWSV